MSLIYITRTFSAGSKLGLFLGVLGVVHILLVKVQSRVLLPSVANHKSKSVTMG